MAISKAQMKAVAKYSKTNYDNIQIRIPKGGREALQAEAAAQNISMTQYIVQAINEKAGRQIVTPAEK